MGWVLFEQAKVWKAVANLPSRLSSTLTSATAASFEMSQLLSIKSSSYFVKRQGMIGSRSDNQYKQSFSSVSSPLPLMSWGHTLPANILISSCSLMMTSGGAWTSSNCTGAVPRHRLLHNLNMQSRHLHLCPQSLFVKHTVDRSCAQCLLWPVDASIRNWCKEKYQERWSMTAGPESSFYLAHLLASMQWHRCRAHVCRNVVCAAEEANCKSSKMQK